MKIIGVRRERTHQVRLFNGSIRHVVRSMITKPEHSSIIFIYDRVLGFGDSFEIAT
jgi:hypothetical protein